MLPVNFLLFIQIILFLFITPGSPRVLVVSYAMTYGMKKTVWTALGDISANAMQMIVVTFVIGSLLIRFPQIMIVMKWLGVAYLLYLAWTMRPNVFDISHEQDGKPMSFLAAALFQFANPKAWIMTISASAMFIPPVTPQWLAIALLLLTFIVVGMPCGGAWLLAGSAIRRHLASAKARNLTALVMVLLILYTAVGIWL